MALAIPVASCGSSSPATTKAAVHQAHGTLNTQRVATAIAQSIMSQRHLHAKVVCPPNIAQEQGLSFSCVATTPTKSKHSVRTLFTVFQKDSAGNVYYQSPK